MNAATDTTDVFAQVRAIRAAYKIGSSVLRSSAYCSDLRKYAASLKRRPTRSRLRRRFMDDPAEIAEKVAAETGFSWDFIAEQWERPECIGLYQAIGKMPGAAISIDDVTIEQVSEIAWMMTAELADVDEDTGKIRLLSDCGESGRRYPGARESDEQITRLRRKQLRGLAVDDIRDAWEMIQLGCPAAEIAPEQRQRMKCLQGIRISASALAYQANAIEARFRDDECRCPGRGDVAHAWELRGHEDGCRCLRTWVSVDTARRAIKTLTAEGVFVRTAAPRLIRENHTFVGLAAAYFVPPDAGWHAFAERDVLPRRQRRRPSKLRRRLEKAA